MSESKIEKILFTFLITLTVVLRLVNLSYSDYIQDEIASFFYWGGQKNTHLTRYEFLLNEPRGPMNVIMAAIPHIFVGNYDNALAQRLPFALFSIAAVAMFYFLVKKLTKNYITAFIATYFLSMNGLIVAYGRVSLYESVLFFFIFSSLYYFSDLLNRDIPNKRALKSSLIGSVLFAIAFYSHWDSVYVLFPITFVLIKYLTNKRVDLKFKLILAVSNLALLSLLILPYYVPYVQNLLLNNERNVEYANSIVGFAGEAFNNRPDIKQFNLYNPFLTLYIYLIFGLIGLFFSKKHPLFIIWFLGVFLFFRYAISYSGLHFYNLLFPTVVLVGIAFDRLIRSKYHLIKVFTNLLLVFSASLFFVQSFLLFVDHRVEYPMEREKILFWKTQKYTHRDELKHKTGFPHKRYWKEINEYVLEQNRANDENYGYHTNEDKGIARIYMQTHNTTGDYFYAIGIKRPYSFANDYKFPQFKPKSTVHKLKNEYGETVVNIYRVEKRKK